MSLPKHIDMSRKLVVIAQIGIEEGEIENNVIGKETCKSHTIQHKLRTAANLHLKTVVLS